MTDWWSKNRQMLARAAGSLLAVVLLAVLIKEESGEDLAASLKSISLLYFAAGIFVLFISRIFVIARWHILLRSASVDISFWRTSMLTFTGLFSSNFLPTTIGGDVVRLTGAIQFGYDRAICLASLIADRMVGILGMAASLPFGISPLLLLGNAKLQVVSFGAIFKKSADFIKHTFEAFLIWIKKPAALFLSFLFTFGNMTFIFFAISLLMNGMGHSVSYWLIAGLWSLTYFVTLIPISVNGFGVQELSLTFLFSKFGGLNHSESLTIAILIRALFIITSLPGAFFLPSILAAMNNSQSDSPL